MEYEKTWWYHQYKNHPFSTGDTIEGTIEDYIFIKYETFGGTKPEGSWIVMRGKETGIIYTLCNASIDDFAGIPYEPKPIKDDRLGYQMYIMDFSLYNKQKP